MPTPATVTASSLNVRGGPSTTASKIGELPRGSEVEIVQRQGSWYEIEAGALRGFVNGDFLHLHTTAALAGFLCHDGGLCAAPVEATGAGRIATAGLKGNPRATAEAWNRYGGMLGPLCEAVELPPSGAVAVLCVESSGRGFVAGRMVIRFENHVFWDKWGKSEPVAFERCFQFDPNKRWTGHQFRVPNGDWTPSHDGQGTEWSAFELARTLNEPAAFQSISMGVPQIMGFNHARIGYDSAGEMFERFTADERFHILGLFDFIKGPGSTSQMLEALRRGEYEQFATAYNGNGQAAVYGGRLRTMVAAFETHGPAS